MSIPFVGKRFAPADFAAYVASVQLDAWRPSAVCLHHTAKPSLAMRPGGLTDQHLQNLLSYYQDELGWSGAPHLFIDDSPGGIIVFQSLARRGVHAKSFNASAWGVEMLGDYDSEDPEGGRGAKVLANAVCAVAVLNAKIGAEAPSLKFHRDDPLTNKTCPGTRITQVTRAKLVARISSAMNGEMLTPLAPEADTSTPSPWAAEAWAWAQEQGLMSGDDPGKPVTREQLALVLRRFAAKGVV